MDGAISMDSGAACGKGRRVVEAGGSEWRGLVVWAADRPWRKSFIGLCET